MKTHIITSHLSDPVEIEWSMEDNELVTTLIGYDRIVAYNKKETIELRDFLNQLEL